MSTRWVRRVTVGAVLIVAAVAAVVSYSHMRGLAQRAGEGALSDVLPLSVDGLLVAATLVIYSRRIAGHRAGVLPWAGLFLGVGASVAANIANADPTVLGRLVAAWPPLAFALSFELLVIVLRDRPATTNSELIVATAGDVSMSDTKGHAVSGWVSDAGERPSPTPARKPRGRHGPDLRAQAVAVLADHPDIGRNQLAKELGVTPHKARTLLDDLRPVNGTKVSM